MSLPPTRWAPAEELLRQSLSLLSMSQSPGANQHVVQSVRIVGRSLLSLTCAGVPLPLPPPLLCCRDVQGRCSCRTLWRVLFSLRGVVRVPRCAVLRVLALGVHAHTQPCVLAAVAPAHHLATASARSPPLCSAALCS
jgi:hypothetical protein